MGNTDSYPFAFRRAIVSLHYKCHPLFDPANSDDSDTHSHNEALRSFWGNLFSSRLSAQAHAAFWTAEDVRQLRMYHPDRLALLLLAAMGQIEAFAAQINGKGSRSGRIDAVTGCGDSTGAPLSRTALVNALRLISGALPYCFEAIEELRAVLCADTAEALRDEQNIVIVSQRTVARMDLVHRKESPYAKDFAHHFFVCGRLCREAVSPPPAPALGSRLVPLLLCVFFTPHASPLPPPEIIHTTSPVWPEWCLFQPFLDSPSALVCLATLQRAVAVVPQCEEEWRGEVLRAALLTLSAPLLADNSASATHAVMAQEIFTHALGAQFGAALLYIVRTYPKRVATFAARVTGRGPSPAHDVVLGHALTILALGIHAGQVVELPGDGGRAPNAFWHALHAVFQKKAEEKDDGVGQTVQVTGDEECGGREGNVMESSIKTQTHCGRVYAEELLDSLAHLIEGPNVDREKGGEREILFRGLALHFIVWILQQGYADRLFPLHANNGNPIPTWDHKHTRDNRVRWLLLLLHCVVSYDFAEVQMGLLCFLALVPCPSFCTFLAEPLVCSSTTVDEAWLLSRLRMIFPMLPAHVSILYADDFRATAFTPKAPTTHSVADDSFSLRTYGDVLTLVLCYILSPSAPRHHRPLHRSALEVLRALHACSPVLSLLSPHVTLELLGSFQHMCAPCVLRPRGALGMHTNADRNAWCNGGRMAQLLCALLQVPGPLRDAIATRVAMAEALRELMACAVPEERELQKDIAALLRFVVAARELSERKRNGMSEVKEKEEEEEEEDEEGIGPNGKENAVESVRRLVADSAEGNRWLTAQVWRQAHRGNLSVPIFDYRTALLLRDT